MAARRGPVLLTHSDLASFHLQAAAAASASCTSGKAAAESKAQQAKQEAAAIEAKLASLQGQVETLAALQTDLDKASRRVGEWAPKRSLDRWREGGRVCMGAQPADGAQSRSGAQAAPCRPAGCRGQDAEWAPCPACYVVAIAPPRDAASTRRLALAGPPWRALQAREDLATVRAAHEGEWLPHWLEVSMRQPGRLLVFILALHPAAQFAAALHAQESTRRYRWQHDLTCCAQAL